MKNLSFKTFLLCAMLACTTNSSILARDWFYTSTYAGCAVICAYLAKNSCQKQKQHKSQQQLKQQYEDMSTMFGVGAVFSSVFAVASALSSR